jgi:hypothetical protein
MFLCDGTGWKVETLERASYATDRCRLVLRLEVIEQAAGWTGCGLCPRRGAFRDLKPSNLMIRSDQSG